VPDLTPELSIHATIQRSRDDMLRHLADMNETVQLTREIIHASRLAMAEMDRLFGL
jgi:hypothetical protein